MRALTAGLLASSLLSFTAHADTLATKDMPVRIELHPLQTLTLTDQQFLTGDKNGRSRSRSSGELSHRAGAGQAAGRHPDARLRRAGGNIGYWQRQLQRLGISTFAIDGMTGRGLTGVGSNQAVARAPQLHRRHVPVARRSWRSIRASIPIASR